MNKPSVHPFFHQPTSTWSYVVSDPDSEACAIIDPVLDFDYASGRTAGQSVQEILDFVRDQGMSVDWILETHVHADHLSATPLLQEATGARTAIGAHITTVQEVFGQAFNAEAGFARDGSQFDRLLNEGDQINIGSLKVSVIHTPGHTPACVSYVIGDAAFVGDTLFMPDYGTARCDFPGGDARALYRSVQKIYALPDSTRLFLCHDYLSENRKVHVCETSVAEQKAQNVHLKEDTLEEEFVHLRQKRDATLDMPQLMIPSVQVNMRNGHLPPAESNGQVYLKVPVNRF